MKVSDLRPAIIRWKDTRVIRRDPTLAEEIGDTGDEMEPESDEGWEVELF
jgi:hypothetical protein